MLVLSRKVGEKFWIGDQISITVVRISGGGVRIGIDAPEDLPVVREELRHGPKAPAPLPVRADSDDNDGVATTETSKQSPKPR